MSSTAWFGHEYINPSLSVDSRGQYTGGLSDFTAIHADPRWVEAVALVVAFAENDASYFHYDEEGSSYVVTDVKDRTTSRRIIAGMVELQTDMSQRHDPDEVNRALRRLTHRWVFNDYPEGVDCGYPTDYAPNGNPPQMLTKPLDRALAAAKLRRLSNDELIAADNDWKEERWHNWQADNYYSIKLQDEKRIPLDQVLNERGLNQSRGQGMEL